MTADWLLTVAIGSASGVASGALGIGGGVITTPAVRLLLHAPAIIAVGTPLPVILPGAVTGAIAYYRRGVADVRAGLLIGLGGAATSVVGAWFAERLGGSVALLATVLIIVWAAVQMVRESDTPGSEDADTKNSSAGALLAVGALTGFYSGFLGLGGGFIVVPLLVGRLRFGLRRALGTSLIAVAVLAVPGTAAHALMGNIDWGIAAGLAVGVVPGAALGAHVSLGASERAVRRAFAIVLAVAGVWLLVNEVGAVSW